MGNVIARLDAWMDDPVWRQEPAELRTVAVDEAEDENTHVVRNINLEDAVGRLAAVAWGRGWEIRRALARDGSDISCTWFIDWKGLKHKVQLSAPVSGIRLVYSTPEVLSKGNGTRFVTVAADRTTAMFTREARGATRVKMAVAPSPWGTAGAPAGQESEIDVEIPSGALGDALLADVVRFAEWAEAAAYCR